MDGGGEAWLGRSTTNQLNTLGLGGFARGRERGAVPGWSSRHSRGSIWTLRGSFMKARVRGICYVLVPWWAERGEDFTANWTGTIKGGMLTTTVDAERMGGIATFYYRFLKASIQTALVNTSVGGTVVEVSADWAGLCLFFAKGSKVTKTPALSALPGLGGGVGRSERAETGENPNGFTEPGDMEWVDCHNNRSCALLSPLCWN